TTLLQEAAAGVEAQRKDGAVFPEWPAGFKASAEGTVARMVSGPLTRLPAMVTEKKTAFEEQKQAGYQDRVGKAVQARKAKSFGRLEACVRAIDFQLREATATGDSDSTLDRDYLDSALETGTGFLAAVKAGEKPMGDPQIQRYMKQTEEKLGMKSPRQKDEADDE
ncbi:MAG: hypothetical protein Q7U75_16485, partial [Desulfobacterales bacterium]|nr:hypothetical protein [Desulfobacterales bacterium]